MAVVVVPAARSASAYGCRRNPGAHDPRCPEGSRMHHGVDIGAPEGSPVFAPMDGVVQQAWPNGALSRYGNLLLVYMPAVDKTAVFAHLAELPARADGTPLRRGDTITAGEQVGLVGYTGACGRGSRVSAHGVRCTPCGPGGRYLCSGPSGAHLHLEIRPGRVNRPNPRGASINPTTFAREHGFELFARTGLGWLGQAAPVYTADPAECDGVKYYCDPSGFEPGDDEPAPLPTPVKAALWIGGSALVAFVVAKVLS